MVQVKNAAIKALTSASAAMGNKDIEKLVPAVISAMANPTQVCLAFRRCRRVREVPHQTHLHE